ncbi:MAG: hypothetical protein Q9187_003903 [Circinaria calcarea]
MARGIPASCRKDATRMPAQINFDTDTDMFTCFIEQGWLPRLYKTLGGGATAQAPGILEDYPWEEITDTTLIDIGGGGALNVLGNVWKAIQRGPRSRFIILESLLEDGRIGRLSRYADLTVMISVNCQERTEAEWNTLAERTGWKLGDAGIQRTLDGLNQHRGNGLKSKAQSSTPGASNEAIADDHKDSTQTLQSDGTLHNEGSQVEEDQVSSMMSFLEPWDSSRGNPFFRSAADEGFESMNFKWTDHAVTITTASTHKDTFTLDENGFAYKDDVDELTPELLKALRRGEKETIKNLYYPKVEAFLKETYGSF